MDVHKNNYFKNDPELNSQFFFESQGAKEKQFFGAIQIKRDTLFLIFFCCGGGLCQKMTHREGGCFQKNLCRFFTVFEDVLDQFKVFLMTTKICHVTKGEARL